jgi:hypothetical protein
MINSITLEEMSQISGGRSKFWDGVCAVTGIAEGAIWLGVLFLTPVGAALVGAGTLTCAIREVVLQNG